MEWDNLPLTPFNTTIIAVGLIIIYFPLHALYNIYLHPLSHIPGPPLWSATRLPFIRALIRGSISHDFRRFHAKYGPVVRIAPNEITFSSPQAWNDILNRADKKVFLKDAIWWKEVPGLPGQILSAIEPETHARVRKLLMPGFTTGALREQEHILQLYTNLLVERLSEKVEDGPGTKEKAAEIDIAPWMNFTTFDIFGDLGFGESFNCLQQSTYHPWVALIFNSVRATSWIAATRFYPLLERAIQMAMPPSARKMIDDHFSQIEKKVERRLNWELQRPDIMSHVIKQDYEKRGMTRKELEANFMMLTTVGSETSATTLTGTFNYLVRNPEKLAVLVEEVRAAFGSLQEMELDKLKGLKYLNAVIWEALRLCPPVPWILPRRVSKGGAEVCGVWVPENTPVSIQQWTMNLDSANYHEPASFHPERWLSEATSPSSPFYHDRRDALQPFILGARVCLGQHLAWAEMRLILAKLLWMFDFSIAPGKTEKWEDMRHFLFVEKKGMFVRYEKREKGLESAE